MGGLMTAVGEVSGPYLLLLIVTRAPVNLTVDNILHHKYRRDQ